jgi:hypothetical protein
MELCGRNSAASGKKERIDLAEMGRSMLRPYKHGDIR